jgi:hypothetical protein
MPEISVPSFAITSDVVPAKAALDQSVQPELKGSKPSCLVADRGPDLASVSELKEIQERVAHPQQDSTLKVYSGKWGVFQRWSKNDL